ncbi:cupin domain-containing protein [Mucilaginibacter rubeus]|uniref:Cupin domain-containing protein n=1 Tax=Mucilaginibacter rubeus TaxID=2027860 RepID=A0AAE6JBT8_9SPHI|nr:MULTISPECIES: cupin domain-containing protein [Mucilaginibacter]QEM02453.1 cupin domain-containing protein [Mucilaginibacter rubeus]QEM15077.1 cupin domain-containing protein [Mucilaginibacter gossypii]QTE42202.1 cupin domain-containing protein [Mucilaginibacter rubeus]QTE48804.1 cupin domain-containing protein [Mucilaginibacter rubeus]QTE53902.1 cupin domain-containing protein [Mucilaginibacter rubeus]
MTTNKNKLATAIIIAALAVLTLPSSVLAQQTVAGRTELQRHDLSIPGREMVQVRVDVEKGMSFPQHTHFGEEIIYVLDGLLEYQVAGQQPVTLKAGDVLFIPYGTVHSVKNVGTTKASELATYIVEKDKPLVTLIK